ncbi:hypothetical protein E1A91_D11G258400v1 [Gossypium mustelinum]|uniref:Uncharacterized protein n=2 Tax=Gossypium TaxID=3633 RepID=A0A5D2SXM1_GOSMU|nr:hypothetical protein ES332_D11G266300v1 [Gossypium tomentosum]TYI57133.1 hypothetical protein E1A91_D11G258400v1 [Gossypium mustelinum]
MPLPLPLYFFSAKHLSTKPPASSSSYKQIDSKEDRPKESLVVSPFFIRIDVCPVRMRPCQRRVRVRHQYDTSTRGFFPCRCFIGHFSFH